MASQSGGRSGADAVRDGVRAAIEPVVRAADLHLEDVAVSRAGARSVVRVVVDLPEDAEGDLDLDAVAEVSRAISDVLDAGDAVTGSYTLEVSTPGTDRPLTERRHFRRARGRVVRLVLRDGSTVEGRLRDLSGDPLVLHLDVPHDRPRGRAGAGRVEVPLADVVRGQVQVELKKALEAQLPDLDDDDPSGTAGPHDEEA